MAFWGWVTIMGRGVKYRCRIPVIVKLAISFSEETLINDASGLYQSVFSGRPNEYGSKSRVMLI